LRAGHDSLRLRCSAACMHYQGLMYTRPACRLRSFWVGGSMIASAGSVQDCDWMQDLSGAACGVRTAYRAVAVELMIGTLRIHP
jgi:hypothetical protein